MCIGREEFDDGFEVDVGTAGIVVGDLLLAVGEELLGLFLSEECHCEVPCVNGPERSFHEEQGPRRSAQEPSDTHHVARDNPTSRGEGSSGRDSYAGATDATEESGSDAVALAPPAPRWPP